MSQNSPISRDVAGLLQQCTVFLDPQTVGNLLNSEGLIDFGYRSHIVLIIINGIYYYIYLTPRTLTLIQEVLYIKDFSTELCTHGINLILIPEIPLTKIYSKSILKSICGVKF